jgi:hypothetical protein
MAVRTTVEILNSSLSKLAEVRALVPITRTGMVLRYSKELSDYGLCTFRISTQDPLFTTFGDIVVPHQYHIRIRRAGTIVWAGAIIDNPQRNKDFVEVTAAEYEFYLDKVLINRTSKVGYGETAPTADIGLHYRIFSSGTMAAAVTAVIQEAQAALGANHVLNGLTVGTIENPNYPNNFATSAGVALTGAWNFSADVVLQFDYQSVLYALKAFGIYAACDFQVTSSLVFNFQKFLGNKNPGITFTYGSRGNIVDYNSPRLGKRMVNDYFGIAATPDGVVLHSEQIDTTSRNLYGLMQSAKAFADIKDQNALNVRLSEELRLVKTPADAPLNVVLNENGYPLGQFDIGDLVNVRIVDGAINYNDTKRVVGITVNLHGTGREMITVQTNTARPEDLVGVNT